MSLVWTKESPTVSGWYWVQFYNERACPRIVRFAPLRIPGHGVIAGGKLFDQSGAKGYLKPADSYQWFAGPIPQPTEPGEGEK